MSDREFAEGLEFEPGPGPVLEPDLPLVSSEACLWSAAVVTVCLGLAAAIAGVVWFVAH